jgi:protease PrsW
MITLELTIRILIGTAPVILFLATLVYLDSYKLVHLKRVVVLVGVGCLVAGASYGLNWLLLNLTGLPREAMTVVAVPVVEEILKSALIVFLIRARRIGFPADAAIQGFAIGTGFALVENLYYLSALPESSVLLWVIRGFGTAIMHGGTTAIFAVISKGLTQRLQSPRLHQFLPGLLLATGIHALFNRFLVSPLISTLFVLLVLPYLFVFFFQRSERSIQNWLGAGFDLDNEILRLINSGEFTSSPIGLYLRSLRQFYPGEVLADMLCYLRLRTEVSLRAKGILMMRENGFTVRPDPEIRASLAELAHLEECIGRTAMSSLAPVVRADEQDLWQFQVLESL